MIKATFVLILLSSLTSACTTILGTVDPVEHKTDNYTVMDLSQGNDVWKKLDPISLVEKKEFEDNSSHASSDFVYQSRINSATISLNTACGERNKYRDLQKFTDELLFSVAEIQQRKQKTVTIHDTPALETTVVGEVNSEPIQMQTVVLRKRSCLYDIMYVSRPENFSYHEKDFKRFISSLRLR